VPPALVFGAAPAPTTTTTPAAPAATPLAKPAAPSLVQAAVAKRAPKREGKGKTRPAKSKEQVKEEMKMRSAIEEKVIEWTQDEKETMLRLPRKECTRVTYHTHTHTHTHAQPEQALTLRSVSTDLLENEKATLLGLIDLVFAYAYNQRTTMVRWLFVIDTHTHTHTSNCWLTTHTQDEPTCESDWTITNISPTLSWLETFGGIGQTLTACVRRSLVYPLYRYTPRSPSPSHQPALPCSDLGS
jgi:protein SHQ1